MKLSVGGTKAGPVRLGGKSIDRRFERSQVVVVTSYRRQGGNLRFDGDPKVEYLVELIDVLSQLMEPLPRRQHGIADEGSPLGSPQGLDVSQGLQHRQGLAQCLTSDPECGRKFALGWQLVAFGELAALDQRTQLVSDIVAGAGLGERRKDHWCVLQTNDLSLSNTTFRSR